MTKSVKFVCALALIGFFLPMLLVAYILFMQGLSFGTGATAETLLFYSCPASIASMALDHSSVSTGIVVWFFICLSNAVLYAALPAVILFLFNSLRSLRS